MGLIGDLIEFSRNKKAVREMKESWIFADWTEEDWERLEAEAKSEVAEKRASESQRSSSRGCCANCVYFSESLNLDAYCSEHGYSFTVDEVVDDVKYRRTCSSFRASW